MKQKYIEKEWKQLVKQEESFLNRNKKEKQMVYQKKISDYAALKYKRRFFTGKRVLDKDRGEK